jgi:histidinol phosphatase-like PHP family hydrolase
MNWQPVDCHAHSTFSDGALTIEQVVERAATLGVRPSISDHISRDVARSITTVQEVERYLTALEQVDVLRGGEFCWHDALWRKLPPDLVQRFTHRIGSLHAVRLPGGQFVHAFKREPLDGLTVEAYMDAHIDSLERLAAEMPVDILAHPTLITLPFRAVDPALLWTAERASRIADALHDAEIAFEISSRYPPPKELVATMVERGVRLSLGSDGHTLEQVANVAAPLALARSLGVADADLYDPTRHGSKTQPVGGKP